MHYPRVWVLGGQGRRECLHILAAEKALGRSLPRGVEVHHVDGDPLNAKPGNLVICQDRAYHRLLHMRARVLAAGGNPNTDQICYLCKTAKQYSAFPSDRSNRITGRHRECRECFAAAYRRSKQFEAGQ